MENCKIVDKVEACSSSQYVSARVRDVCDACLRQTTLNCPRKFVCWSLDGGVSGHFLFASFCLCVCFLQNRIRKTIE